MATTVKNTDNTLLTMVRGNAVVFSFTINSDSVPLNLTGGTFYFTVKNHYDDASNVLQKSNAVHDNPTAGQTSITLARADTIDLTINKNYIYDFTFVTAAGGRITVLRGNFNLSFNAT